MSTINKPDLYWRQKLDAYMHDNLSKPLDVKNHESRAYQLRAADMIEPEERYEKQADFHAAAADRLPFPNARALVAPFDGMENTFKHPLSSGCHYQADHKKSASTIDEVAQGNKLNPDQSTPQAEFIGRWRTWRLWTQSKAPESAFFPADTRIPDHTLWNHLGITSAFQGCFGAGETKEQPSLLLFTLGPVQPMIAAARRIGDLWSGSYLLSYLVATALGEIAKTYGPDHVLFPSLWGQPLIDLQLRDIYQSIKIRDDQDATLWESLWSNDDQSRQRYLLPSLPNRFLALLPSSEASDFAKHLEQVIHDKLEVIAKAVDRKLDITLSKHKEVDYQHQRLLPQLKRSLEMSWQTLELPKSVEEAESWAIAHLPKEDSNNKEHSALTRLRKLRKTWDKLPNGHHTSYGLNTPSSAWPISFALLSWALDAVKNTRIFEAWSQEQSGWEYGKDQNKDSLTGKEEAVLSIPNNEKIAKELGKKLGLTPATFRANETLGALTLIKRLWHAVYLSKKYDFELSDFQMPDTHQLSQHALDACERAEEELESEEKAGYIAVLALDGDEMGKWISGAKNQPLEKLLAAPAIEYYKTNAPEFLKIQRPLNPSFHLQFSEALGNFGIHTARRIVEWHKGKLIYAGGDDVLAILPANKAIDCASALRRAFRGQPEKGKACDEAIFNLEKCQPGFLRLNQGDDERDLDPVNYDIMVPGPGADVSAGIAIGHAKSPLQDLVRAAQTAEKLAKNDYGRAAMALSIFKRSGEIQHWGAKWSDSDAEAPSPAFELLLTLSKQLADKTLEARFPYKLIARLTPFLPQAECGIAQAAVDPSFAKNLDAILQLELKDCLGEGHPALKLFDTYLQTFEQQYSTNDTAQPTDPTQRKLVHLIGLLRSVAWIAKHKPVNSKTSSH